MAEHPRRTPAQAVTGMVGHVLAVAETWTAWDGMPAHVEDRVCTPHKAIRRVADHLIDHLAELEARLGEPNEDVTLVVAELAANAVRHGRVSGRGFRVRLLLREESLRVEVSDARVDRLPVPAREPDEGGRGLLLVEALAERWGVELRPGGAYKTVWAELRVGACGG